jgi:hypothetical protein
MGRRDFEISELHPFPKGSYRGLARVAQAFDFSAITHTVGAPSFALFAKGGYSTAVSEST